MAKKAKKHFLILFSVLLSHIFYIFVHCVFRFLNPDLEDLRSQGSGSSLITDHGSRILDRRPLAEQKTTSEQVWTPGVW